MQISSVIYLRNCQMGRKHTKQRVLQAQVNSVVRICKTREEHKKEREKEGTNILWLESY